MTYVEKHAALNRRLVAVGGVGPIVVLAAAVWLTTNRVGRPFRTKLPGHPNPTWIAPTRRPAELAGYLQSLEVTP